MAVGAAAASIYFTDVAGEVGTVEAYKRLLIFTLITLPLTAFVIKATSNDGARFRAAFRSERGSVGPFKVPSPASSIPKPNRRTLGNRRLKRCAGRYKQELAARGSSECAC